MMLSNSELRAEKAAEALLTLNREAVENGTSGMSLDEINAEIEDVRRSRK